MRTLLVEDNPQQRATIGAMIQRFGHEVTSVAEGESGLLAHLKQPFDLLILDWVMPGLDGLQLCRRIRALRGGDVPYLLVVTGRTRPVDLAEVLDAGADDYIAKPVDFNLLHTRIRIAERRIGSALRHREAQQALAQSETDFQRVIERCPLGVFAHQDGQILYANERAAATLGLTSHGLIGRPIASFVAEPFQAEARANIGAFETGETPPGPMVLELMRADGQRAVARMIFATRATFNGSRASFTLVEDVTERQRAEKELQMIQFAVDNAQDAALWIGADERFAYVNHAACAITGLAREALLGRRCTDVELRDPLSSGGSLWPRILDGNSVPYEGRLIGRGGVEIPVEIAANAVEFDGRRMVVASVRDVSERHRMQASLQKADRLASVGSLAAGVAHEINNPLAYVIANIELADEAIVSGRPAEDLRKSLAEAIGGAHRVRRIVGDLKSFARSNEDEPSPVDVIEVLQAAIEIANNEIRHRARLVRDYGPIKPVRADEGRLLQVFLNLLVNAAHAIPEGDDDLEHTITVRTLCDPTTVMVEIRDTGSGIAPDIIDHIFDPFFTTKPQGLGTGLGLSICHGIVSSVGGKIEVHSELGRGSTFRVRIPAAEPMPRAVAEHSPTPLEITASRKLRILVVDDEPLICDGISRALGMHDVRLASGGREAIRLCANEDFDLVLCDVMMPDISGIEVFARIGAERPWMRERFVFMTGGAFTPKTRAFLESIENDQLTKPFSLRELRTLVAKRAALAGPVELRVVGD